jgi:hypothetical protein
LARIFLAGTFILCLILAEFSQSWGQIIKRPGKGTTGIFYLDKSNELKDYITDIGLKIMPSLVVKEEYNDNIFLNSTNEEGDFITTIRPGISLSLPGNYLKLDLNYGLEYLIFQDHTEANETSPSDTQRASLNAEILPDRDFSVKVQDDIYRVVIDERRPFSEENTYVNKTTLNHLMVNPRYQFRSIQTIEATLGYQFEQYDYQSSQANNASSNTFTLGLVKNLSSRFDIFANYAFQLFQAEGTEDYRLQYITGGFSWTASPRLKLEGFGGVSLLDYRDSQDHTLPRWQGKAEFQATKRVSLELLYQESLLLSTDEGVYRSKSVTGNIGYDGKVGFVLSGSAIDNIYNTVNREDRSAGGGTVLSIPLNPTFNLRFQGRYTYFRFLPEKVDVRKYALGGYLGYVRKNLAAYLGYFYQRSDSDNNENDYRNNIIYMKVELGFGRGKVWAVNKNETALPY